MGIIQQNSRIQHHQFSGLGLPATVPSQEDFTNPQTPWLKTDLVDGEIGVNTTDSKLFIRIGGVIIEIPTGGGSNIGDSDLVIDAPTRSLTLNGDAAADSFEIKKGSGTSFFKALGDERIQTGKIEVGKVGTPVQYGLNFQGNFASSGLAKGLNHLGALIFDFRQFGADASLGLNSGAGVQNIFLNGNSGKINVVGKYQVGGVDGFTGTGAYTNFTISGGIITNAT